MEPGLTLDLDALETSFDLVAPRGEELVDVFYARLFEATPEVRSLYPSEMRKQKAMFLGALVLVRKSLRDFGAIAPKLRELGARHVAYGATQQHYYEAGAIFVAALAEVAGEAWTARFEQAWIGAFGLVAATMLEGAAQVEVELAA